MGNYTQHVLCQSTKNQNLRFRTTIFIIMNVIPMSARQFNLFHATMFNNAFLSQQFLNFSKRKFGNTSPSCRLIMSQRNYNKFGIRNKNHHPYISMKFLIMQEKKVDDIVQLKISQDKLLDCNMLNQVCLQTLMTTSTYYMNHFGGNKLTTK